MTNKELIMTALKGGETPRPAWVPFVGVHGGYIIGKTASEYLKSSDLIVEGVLKAYELYQGDGMPVSFDLQMEAEVLGCELHGRMIAHRRYLPIRWRSMKMTGVWINYRLNWI